MDDYLLGVRLTTAAVCVGLLVLGGVLTSPHIAVKWHRWALVLFCAGVGGALLLPLRAVATWLTIPDILFFAASVIGGIVAALVVHFGQSGRPWAACICAGGALLGIVGVVGGLGPNNAHYGWGLSLLPPFVLGIFLTRALAAGQHKLAAYLASWAVVMLVIIMPQYVAAMEENQSNISYALTMGRGTGTDALDQVVRVLGAEITSSTLCVAGSLVLLLLPLLSARFQVAPGSSSRSSAPV